MKKKALALLLAAAMAIQPLSVAGAAEFTDGESVNVEAEEEVVEQDAEVSAEMFTDDVPEERKAKEASVAPSETAIQMGDNVWAEFNEAERKVTISGSGAMWDYLSDGGTLDKHENPFKKWVGVQVIEFEAGITHISDNLQPGYKLSSVVLPESLTSIGDSAFRSCENLSQIELPESLTSIGDGAFKFCSSLNQIKLPENLTNIGDEVFFECYSLSQIKLPENLTNIGDEVFFECYSLSQIKLPENLISIGDGAFSWCRSLNQIELPESLTSIGDSAFSECRSLNQIELPESLTSIGSRAFFGCIQLDNVCIPQGVSDLKYMVFGDCSFLSNVTLPEGLQRIADGTFSNCIRLQEITIPQSVREISCEAYDIFEGCNNLKTIKGYTCSAAKKYYNSLPEEHKKGIAFESIGEGTHQWSTEKITIKESTCEEPGEKAFICNICGNFSDKEIIDPLGHGWDEWYTTKDPTETEEGERQRDCWRCGEVEKEPIPKLSPIRFQNKRVYWQYHDKLGVSASTNKPVYFYVEYRNENESKPTFDESKLDTTRELTKYINASISSVPEEPVKVYLFVQDADGNNTYTILEPYYEERPEKPATTIKVGDNITAIIEGDTLTLTGSGAIWDYDEDTRWYDGDINRITKVVFKGNITYLGAWFFGGFSGLEKLVLPDGLKEMGENVIAGCNSLATIKFPSTLNRIPNLSYEYNPKSLTTVIIPEGVKCIGAKAFSGHSKLTNVNLPSSIQSIEAEAFSATGIETFDWPSNVKMIPESVFSSSKLTEFVVPEEVAKIEKYAFSSCENLNEIKIPKSVSYIGDNAFVDCLKLTIYGERDSQAEKYAYINNIPFVSNKFKVVFKENGRSIGKPQYVKKGENATPPTLTPRPGYTLSWDADYTNITEDMVINAVWTKNDSDKPEPPSGVYPPSETKYTVTFKDRGEVVKTEKVVSGESADYPYLYRYGYKLSWDKDFSKVTSNMTVNAVWTAITPVKVTSLSAELLTKQIRLSWDRAEYADYYLVYRKAAADKSYKQVAKTTKVLWTDKKAKPGVEYQYKVAAVSALEGKKYQGEYSDSVTAKIGTPEKGKIYTVGKLNYKVMNTKEVRVTSPAKVSGSVNIPNTVTISGKVFKVTSIDHKAFYRNENIVNVKIGNHVNYVGQYSFYQCPNLESVKFGNKVKNISTCAFTQCPKLENVTLPSNLEQIGAKTFYQCKSIKVLTIKSSKLKYLGKKALAVNSKITIRVPKAKYSAYVKMIQKSGKYSKTKFQKF